MRYLKALVPRVIFPCLPLPSLVIRSRTLTLLLACFPQVPELPTELPTFTAISDALNMIADDRKLGTAKVDTPFLASEMQAKSPTKTASKLSRRSRRRKRRRRGKRSKAIYSELDGMVEED